MRMWLNFLVMGCVFSMYIFPFTFTFLPIGNTKIFLAVFGLLMWISNMMSAKGLVVSKSMVKISVWALAVSFISILTITYNDATDKAYVGYIVSMWVWVGAAYFVCYCIKFIHKRLDVNLICNYFIGVCVAQCIFALLNEFVPPFNGFVNRVFIQQTQEYLEAVDRMYGIGAAFDTAGTRFACALIMIPYLLTNDEGRNTSVFIWIYVISFVFISIVGNMVARTTSAGMLIGLCYLVYRSRLFSLKISYAYLRVLKPLFIIILVAVPLSIYLYSNPQVKSLFDFAFEGFINMAKTGTWETGSTNELLLMWEKLPQAYRTWIIGDGYFMSPYLSNPYYTGYHSWTFYMGTDVGYLRFIYYFGLLGLAIFALFFVSCARECIINNKTHKALFLMILIMNFIIWAKVATDLFCVFAPFLMMDSSDVEERIELSGS